MNYKIVTLIILISAVQSCKKKNEISPLLLSDRMLLLNNFGYNMIVSDMVKFQTSVSELKEYANSYLSDPEDNNRLSVLRNKWLVTLIIWKKLSVFIKDENGSDLFDKIYYTHSMREIEQNIDGIPTEVDRNFIDQLSNQSKGLMAIEYLIYGDIGDVNSDVVNSFTMSNSVKRIKFTKALILDLQSNSDNLLYRWSAGGGNYIAEYVSKTGTDRNSSLGRLVNQLAPQIQSIKDQRLGILLGINDNNISQPQLVEGGNSDESFVLMAAELEGLQNIFTGLKNETPGGKGLNLLLDKANAKFENELLSDKVLDQFGIILAKIDNIRTPLRSALTEKRKDVLAIYGEIDKLHILVGTDVVDSLGFGE